jgi:hypothetical protein
MKIYCPACRELVQAADVDLASGWAKCAACQEVFEISKVLPAFRSGAPAPEAALERPFNARAIVQQAATDLEIFVPRQGFRVATLAMLGFATFWLGFIAFWTAGALGLLFGGGPPQPMNLGFAAFSIPFWIIGFVMLGGIAWSVFGTKRVQLDSNELRTETRCLLYSKRRTIDRTQVQCARAYVPKVQSQQSPNTNYYGAEIIFEKGSYLLPADDDAEATWLIAVINDFLQNSRR